MRVLLMFLGLITKEEYYNTESWGFMKFYFWLLKGKPGKIGGE